jgi:hypothetical protein
VIGRLEFDLEKTPKAPTWNVLEKNKNSFP